MSRQCGAGFKAGRPMKVAGAAVEGTPVGNAAAGVNGGHGVATVAVETLRSQVSIRNSIYFVFMLGMIVIHTCVI